MDGIRGLVIQDVDIKKSEKEFAVQDVDVKKSEKEHVVQDVNVKKNEKYSIKPKDLYGIKHEET